MHVEKVIITRQVVESLLNYSRIAHPKEGILLLRGRSKKGIVEVTGLIIPPGAIHGKGFSSFDWFMLPIDLSFIGVAHSHPSGLAFPSDEDVLHAVGKIMIIVAHPYEGESCIGVYDRDGTLIPFEIK